MTAPQQPEPGKHCEHECMGEVCARYRLQGSRGFPCSANNGEHSTVGKQCKHDTRSRHAPTPEAPETKQAYRNGFEEGFEIGKAQCETHHEDMKAEAAAKARGEVLDKLREWSIVQYEISGVIDTMTLKQKIESLRTGGDPR